MDKKKSTWEEVGGNLASYIFDSGDNSVMQILELGYKHLAEHLKPCFLYFGAFEEDKEIPLGKLMRLWISEGFVRKEEEKRAENIAEEYLMELTDKNLVMVAKRRSDGGVKAFVIQDLLRDLCLKRYEEENFMKFVKSNDYSIYEKGHCLQSLEHHIHSSPCQHVRSFHGRNLFSSFYVRDMRSLRVLHFDYIHSHFIGIEYLVNLRYLVIRSLPSSIGSLVNLEYLRVEAYGMMVHLPPSIVKMRKLKYLYSSAATYDKDCDNSQTNNLEVLFNVIIGELKDEEILKCSPHLHKLKCYYLQSSSEWSAYGHVDLHFFTQLDSLSIGGAAHVEKISFPSNIRKLTLSCCSELPWKNMSIIGRLESNM